VSPYGFWGRLGREDFPLPVEQQQTIDRFMADFGLVREEPGLSIVVPFPREEELSFERLIDSVTRQYFYPITRGDLSVVVEHGWRNEIIDHRSVERSAAAHGADGP